MAGHSGYSQRPYPLTAYYATVRPVNQVQRTPERQYTRYQFNTLHDTTAFQTGLMDSLSSGLTSHLTQNVILEILFPASLFGYRRHILARRPRFPIKVTIYHISRLSRF